MEVYLKFLNSLSDLARKFRFASDTLSKCDSYYTINVSKEKCECGKEYVKEGSKREFLGVQDKRIIEENLINTENPHKQLRKTISIDFEIYNITRALLQEFARHPIGNPFVVKSTRYSLHRIAKDERIYNKEDFYYNKVNIDVNRYGDRFVYFEADGIKYAEDIIKDYFYISENDFYNSNEQDNWVYNRLEELVLIKHYKLQGMKNDQLKKYINDYMYCNITGNMSGEALWNLLKQRLDKVAWYQFQDLAKEIYRQIPDEWKLLFKVYKYKKIDISEIEWIMTDESKRTYEVTENIVVKIKEILSKNLVEKEYLV